MECFRVGEICGMVVNAVHNRVCAGKIGWDLQSGLGNSVPILLEQKTWRLALQADGNAKSTFTQPLLLLLF
jgi:hypothetical protein